MAVDMFIKIKGIDGESKDDKHTKEIDVLAWSWGMSQNGSFHVGGGGGSGKVSVQDLSITKYIDSASNKLMLACCTGEHIDEATLYVRKAGKDALEYIVIKLEQVMVTHVQMGGSGGEDKLTENITLNFAKYSYDYTPQDQKGKGTGKMSAVYDMSKNKA